MNNTVTPSTRTTDFTERTVEINEVSVTIRPIKHNDRMLEAEFINKLSAEAKHFRFLGGVNQLSDDDLSNLCDVDYHDSMAFVALTNQKETPTEIGVVRYCKSEENDKHEMAITIADDYRKTDLPKVLFEQLIAYAKLHGVKTLYSMDLFDNQDMRDLAKQFEMTSKQDPLDTHQVIYTLHV